ncbi:sensor histidine kinase [Nocardiopsis kunsanensis]|uniref:Oxygen sensor histidine kinase NreB n=1 Tax=Nocardiopsis kunsanensis TaxID=141693 RepID=A0A918XCH9_9ACTN|nr:sensor histidine kinase [Nocardiopsis kunsanensis]GHD25757.1 hypothetical protein GCM10007147_23170 [Nocardiopsis kunsanensis]
MTTTGDRAENAEGSEAWQTLWGRFLVVVPWVLLTASLVAVLALPGQSAAEHTTTVVLGLVAALWLLFGHRVAVTIGVSGVLPFRWSALVHVCGLLLICSVMLAHDELFLIFTITGFVHAMLLPTAWAFAAVGATSLVLHSSTMGLPGTDPGMPLLQHTILFGGVVAVQTLGIGAGLVAGQMGARRNLEHRQMVERLEQALAENADLHARVLTQVRQAGIAEERGRMAREIHDTLAQGLTGIITQIQATQRTWGTPGTAATHLERALALAKESLTEARRSVEALRPQQLSEGHLPSALAELVRRWGETHGTRVSSEVTGDPVALSPAIEAALFRVAQEALTNVARHAQASRAVVTLSYLDEVVLLDVRDDGRGMARGRSGGFGLSSMRQRIRSIGGSVEIESEDGRGTAVSASVPVVPDTGPEVGP